MQISQTELNFLTKEYEKLKDEQLKRIEFRDHMIYLTLGVIGAVFSFCLEKPEYNIAFLVLPFICAILGWTYFANDRKVSEIKIYIKSFLLPQLIKDKTYQSENWEVKKTEKRKFSKLNQLIIDIILFIVSSFVSIGAFLLLNSCFYWYHYLAIGLETLMLIYLSWLFTSNYYD